MYGPTEPCAMAAKALRFAAATIRAIRIEAQTQQQER
jgi:hypothetical protein